MLKLEASVRQMEMELVERSNLEHELDQLNRALEMRLAEVSAQLAEARDELQREKLARREDDKEISLLRDHLAREKYASEGISRELESLGYSISHDLRSPLRHLVGFSEILFEEYRGILDVTAQGYLERIGRAGRKMDSLIEALVKLSRVTRQELNLAGVDLSEMAREHAASLRALAPGRDVVFTIADKLPAHADAALLNAALGNLLGNAWKYTGKKETATIELGGIQDGEKTVFFVSDNGAGFDMEYADRLFGPFQRMHSESEFEGAGLGLATVQRIIHKHGGRIWAEAEIDGGATFFFTLSR